MERAQCVGSSCSHRVAGKWPNLPFPVTPEQNVGFLVLNLRQSNPQTKTSRLVLHLAALGQNRKETQMPGLGNC